MNQLLLKVIQNRLDKIIDTACEMTTSKTGVYSIPESFEEADGPKTRKVDRESACAFALDNSLNQIAALMDEITAKTGVKSRRQEAVEQ
ncbi:MAG: hypothetical protein ACE3JK_14070 [Sporolactobacillus sp.]